MIVLIAVISTVAFGLICIVISNIPKKKLEKALKPLIKIFNEIFQKELADADFQGFKNLVSERNRQYHNSFVKQCG